MNAVKRSASTSPCNRSDIDELEEDIKPAVCDTPVTPPAKKPKKARTPKTSPFTGSDTSPTSTPKRSPKKASGSSGSAAGEWTAEKREHVLVFLIGVGYKTADIAALAKELGLKPQQIHNQMAPSRKGSMRDKAIRAVKGDFVGGGKAE